jgi:beta-glucosidase
MITGVLKGRMGFEGFVVSDWQAIDQLPGDYASDVRTSVTAGLDMVMVPTEYPEFVRVLVAEVEAGRVPMARVDDAVGRILTQKFRLGLFEKPYADTTHLAAVGSAAHRAVAREAVAGSQVLLRNEGAVLPLRPGQRVYVAGANADDLGRQSGGWTLSWQGAPGRTTSGTTILEAMRRAAPGADIAYSADASAPIGGYDVGVVVIGEAPYAEGMGDVGNGHVLEPSAADRAAIERVCGAVPCAVLVVSGRPQLLGDRLPAIDALVASWLPGTEGDGVADVLYGRRPFTSRLPVSWPASESQLPLNVGDARYAPLFPYGWGLTTLAPPPAGGAPALRAAERTVRALRAAGRAHTPETLRLVERARLVVQDRIGPRVAERSAKPFAEAEHLLMSGDPVGAVRKLREAYAAAKA